MKKFSYLLLTLIFLIFCISLLNCGNDSHPPNPMAGPNAQFAFVQYTGGSDHVQGILSPAERRYRMKHPELFRANHPGRGNGLRAAVGNMESGPYSAVLKNTDGTGAQTIVSGYWIWSVQESYDGKKGVACALDDSGYLQIYCVDFSDKQTLKITQLTTSEEWHYSPQLSWDGSKIIYMKLIDVGLRAFVINTSGGSETEIQTAVNVFSPSFTRDGKILFEDEDTDAVAIMNIDGTGVTQLTTSDGTTFDEFPSVSSDGKTIVFSRSASVEGYVVDVWSANIDGTNLKQLTTDGLSIDPMFVNNKIVFISWRDGNAEVYAMNADGTNPKRLTNDTATEYLDEFDEE